MVIPVVVYSPESRKLRRPLWRTAGNSLVGTILFLRDRTLDCHSCYRRGLERCEDAHMDEKSVSGCEHCTVPLSNGNFMCAMLEWKNSNL